MNFEEPIITNKKFDNTHDRIHGERREELMYTENYYYGKSKNAADELPKVGRRTADLESQVIFRLTHLLLDSSIGSIRNEIKNRRRRKRKK